MKNLSFHTCLACLVSLTPVGVHAQDSVGRGWPVSADAEWVGAGVPYYNIDMASARDGNSPAGITPLPRDIFTSDDFYVDREYWTDPRYFRCNSMPALDSQWGDYSSSPKYITDDSSKGAWGNCDVDYPRENLVSPYGFDTAQAHYDALLNETRRKGGPTQYSRDNLPPDWDGRYTRNINTIFLQVMNGQAPNIPKEYHEPPQWIVGYYNQMPTILSLLTPEYQQRLVQQLYHQAHDNAAQWSGMFCRPEGFMRLWSVPAGPNEMDLSVTPSRVQFWGGFDNAMRNVYPNREFNMSGVVPRLGADIPQWMGETVGFWDGETLISWTSNIQGWFSHALWEHSSKLQTIEIYTPRKRDDGSLIGLEHEAIFYDEEGLVQPVRQIQFLSRVADYNDVDPLNVTHCNQTIFNINGRGVPMTPGSTFEYEVEDLLDRSWAHSWEKYFEQHMQQPEDDESMFSFE
jgi:hypothetical protein